MDLCQAEKWFKVEKPNATMPPEERRGPRGVGSTGKIRTTFGCLPYLMVAKFTKPPGIEVT